MIETIENRINIRLCVPSDLPEIFTIVDQYSDGKSIDRNRVKNNLRDLLYIQGVMCAEYAGYMIGGVAGFCFNCMFNDDVFFVVQFFYIRNRFRHLTKEFLRELEICFLSTKVKKIVFGVIEDEHSSILKRFLRMNGYSQFETNFAKTL